MWFRRDRPAAERPPYPGEPAALDGLAAAGVVETRIGAELVIQSDPVLAELAGPMRRILPGGGSARASCQVVSLEQAPGLAAGLAAGGLRCGVVLSELAGLQDALPALAGRRLPLVIHLCGRALRRQAGALQGGHEDFYTQADAGLFQLFAANVQQVADFSLIARRVAELSLTPGLCAQDLYATAQSVQDLALPEPALVRDYLGAAGDDIVPPTPAQALLFGAARRRVPRLTDADRPAGLGGIQDRDSYLGAVAAQRPYFAEHLEAFVAQAMEEFGDLTGRRYAPLETYRAEDAELIVVAIGAIVEKLAAVIDYLRAEEGIRVGLVNPVLWRPFPGAESTRLLAGKRALTVLERADTPLAGDGPLARELRAALDKAGENAVDDTAWPGYASYRRPADRPQLFCGSYGIGSAMPSFEALCAVVRNMLPGGERRRRFYVGVQFERDRHSFPQLALVQQRLRDAYPHLGELSLPEPPLERRPPCARALALHSVALQSALTAGNLFARAWHGAVDEPLRSFAEGGLEPGLQPVRFVLVHGDGDCRTCPPQAETTLVSGEGLLAGLDGASLCRGGALVVACDRSPEALWQDLPRRVERWMRERDIRLFTLDARQIADEAATHASFVDQLEIWGLLGAALALEGLPEEAAGRFDGALEGLLEALFAEGTAVAAEILRCVRAGRDRVAELDWRALPAVERAPEVEREAPWTVADSPGEEDLFHRGRFWHSVGYLHDSGRSAETLVDPFLAAALMPAGSSARRDMRPYRLRLPRWLPENCTACGLCWSLCPDSALPGTIRGVAELIEAAVGRCKADGAPMTQMARIAGQLGKVAHKIVARDELAQYRDAGALLGQAFDELGASMAVDEETRAALAADFERLRREVDGWPIARTDRFFAGPEARGKGAGRLLSIALNTASCKACGLCVAACPEDAFEWAAQTDERVAAEQRNWGFQMGLPRLAPELIAASIDAEAAETEANRLLDRAVYHSMVGGDGAVPGSGAKTAVHLVTAAIEAVMQERYRAHAARLRGLIDGLRARIQGEVADAVQINDFEEFAARLSRVGTGELTPESLAGLFDPEDPRRRLDEGELARRTGLLSELETQHRAYADPEAGRARLVLVLDSGEVMHWSGTWPDNPHVSPWLGQRPGDGAGIALGLAQGMAARLCREFAACRLAKLELEGRFRAAEHGGLRDALRVDELDADERALLPPVLIVAERGGTRWQDLERLPRSDLPLDLLILDRGGGTEATDGSEAGGDCAAFALDHAQCFVLQGSIAFPGHLIRGVTRSLASPRPALFQVHAPDPLRCGIAPEQIAAQARLACESRAWPLYRRDAGADALSLDGNPEPVAEAVRLPLTARDAAGAERTIERELTLADWAIGEARFRHHFELSSPGRLGDDALPLAACLALPPAERAGRTPYIDVADGDGRHCVAAVAPDLVVSAERVRVRWARLRAAAGAGPGQTASVPAAAASPPPPPAREAAADEADADAHAQLTARLLELCGFSTDPDFFARSLREFATRAETSPDEARADD